MYDHFKAFADRICAFLGLILSAPVFAVLAVIVAAQTGFPVFLKQKRSGLKGKPFTLYKFRTMTGQLDSKGELLPDKKRLTALGRFLRRMSLDELPELFNVLKGDMSLVGPRPHQPKEVAKYHKSQLKLLAIKPGITGLAQISESVSPFFIKTGIYILKLIKGKQR